MKFEVVNHGTLIGFTPISEDAKEWWDEYVQWSPMMGDAYLVEARYAQAIIDGIEKDGGQINQ